MAELSLKQFNKEVNDKGKSDSTRPPLVLFYCRVSSQEQAREGTSLESQQVRLEAEAEHRGWEAGPVFADKGIPGDRADRPGLTALRNAIRSQQGNIVMVAAFDRLARKLKLFLDVVDEIQQAGLKFYSLREGLDTSTPFGKFGLQMMGAAAELEHGLIQERTREARHHLKARHQWSSGRTPYGYRFNKEHKELTEYGPEAVVVREIFTLYLGEELGQLRLAERLNQLDRPTPRLGRRKHDYWTKSTVGHVLSHWGYIGGPNENWPFKTPQIIEPHVFHQAQQRLLANRHIRPCHREPRELQGLLRCSICGHTLRIALDHGRPKYECPGRRRDYHLDGSDRCTLPRFGAKELESFVDKHVKDLFSHPVVLAAALRRTLAHLKDELSAVEQRLRPLKSQLVELDRKAEVLDAKLDVGRIDLDTYRAAHTGISARRRQIERAQREQDPALLSNRDEIQTRAAVTEQLIAKLESSDKVPQGCLGGTRDVMMGYGLVGELIPRWQLRFHDYDSGKELTRDYEEDGALINGCFLALEGSASGVLGALGEVEEPSTSPGCR